MKKAIALLLVAHNVSAYLDPGTGSQLLQVALGSLFAIGFALKMYWKNIMQKLKGQKKTSKKNG